MSGRRTWGHPFDPRTMFLGRRRGARLSLSAVTDAPAADRAAGLRLRPSSQPHRRVPATADVEVEAQEDGHANVLVILIDLDVVETIYDPVKELDSERLIIRLDIYPIPRGRPEVSAIRVRNRRISTGRPPKKSFRLSLGNSSHAPSSTNRRCERQRAPRSADNVPRRRASHIMTGLAGWTAGRWACGSRFPPKTTPLRLKPPGRGAGGHCDYAQGYG
jgi:hypothetical protein